MPPKDPLSATSAAELKGMYERGDRLVDIARHFRISEKTLRVWCAEQQLARRKTPRKNTGSVALDARRIDGMLQQYSDQSVPLEQILKEYSVSLSRFYAELQKSGRPRRTNRARITQHLGTEVRSKIVSLYAGGSVPVKQIAAKFGVDYHHIYVVLREAGVHINFSRSKLPRRDAVTQKLFSELYADEAVSIAVIMTRLSLTRHDVDWLIDELDLKRRGRGGTRRGRIARAQAA